MDLLNSKEKGIYLANQPVDMRKSINTLCIWLSEHELGNPGDGSVYVFYNRGRDKIKVLYYDVNGFVIFYKRLEKRRYSLPRLDESLSGLDELQLKGLLLGLSKDLWFHGEGEKYQVFV